MLGYTTKNACLTRMNINAMIAGLTLGIDDILTCINFFYLLWGQNNTCIHLQIFITKKIAIFLTRQLH
jgi:hypothetical protein